LITYYSQYVAMGIIQMRKTYYMGNNSARTDI